MSDPVLVLGATSGIGKFTVAEAIRRGIAVRGFARSADTLVANDLLEPVKGDARNEADVLSAVTGCRAVIYALGIRERLAMLWEKETLFSDTTRVLISAMETAKVRRLVVVTGFGAGRSRSAMSRIEQIGHRAVLGGPYADKDRQEALIMESDLDWTIIRPVILTNGRPSDGIRVLRDPAQWRNGLISRADVAGHLLDTIEMDLDIRRDVIIAR